MSGKSIGKDNQTRPEAFYRGCRNTGVDLIRAACHILSLCAAAVIVSCTGRDAPSFSQHGAIDDAQQDVPAVTSRLDVPASNERVTASDTIEFSVSPWRFATFEGQYISTPNYRIYTTVEMDRFTEQLPLFYELALTHYTSVLGDLPMPDQPLETYLFQDRRQWEAKTRQLLPEQANIFNTLGRGGFTTRGIAVLYYIDHRRSVSSRDTFAIAAHEGWHQYTQQTFSHHLPVWLEEGIATYMESFSLSNEGTPRFRPWSNNERRFALARAVRNDDLIPLSELLARSPQSFLERGKTNLLVYYAQVWALARFLVEGEDGEYREALEQVLQDAARGALAGRLMESQAIGSGRRRSAAMTSRVGPWIILEYFNSDLDEFERQYHDFVEFLVDRRRR